MNITYISSHVFLIHLIFTFLSDEEGLGLKCSTISAVNCTTYAHIKENTIYYIYRTCAQTHSFCSSSQLSVGLEIPGSIHSQRPRSCIFATVFLFEFWFENFISTGYKPLQQNIESQKKNWFQLSPKMSLFPTLKFTIYIYLTFHLCIHLHLLSTED